MEHVNARIAGATLAAGLLVGTLGPWAGALDRGDPPPGVPSDTRRHARAADSTDFAVRDVRLFDGRDVREGVTVLVRGGRIASVGPDVEVPEDVRVVSGEGRTLLPGLIDAHVHTFAESMLRDAAVLGVTTELDMMTLPDTARRLQREQRRGEASGRADLFAAGYAATAPDGHGTEYGVEVPTLEEPGDAEPWVEARAEEGADYIKIIYDDGSAVGRSIPTLASETVERLVEAAHERGLLAVTHVMSLADARFAVGAGSDVLAHAWMDSVPRPEDLRLLLDEDAAVVPTLAVYESISGLRGGERLADDPRLAPYLLPQTVNYLERDYAKVLGRDSARDTYDRVESIVAALHRAGVPVLAGTDAPNPGTAHGPSLHRELELLVGAGLSPREALAAATAVPAETFGLEDRGRVEEGLRADLVLVAGDPTTDVTATREIVAVWKAGHRVDREAYRERVAAAGDSLESMAERPAPEGSESGLVSDFDRPGEAPPRARFGVGWTVSTDRMMGGTSTATIEVVEDGAGGSAGALRVAGQMKGDAAFPWAGALFQPGEGSFQPANLSRWDALSFRARGDGGTHRVMIFARALGRQPAIQSFEAGPEWDRHVFRLESFQGIDGSGVMGVLFSGGSGRDEFEFYIDDVRFVERDSGGRPSGR